MPRQGQWTNENSLELYNINRWSEGYFSVNENGQMIVLPDRDLAGPQIIIEEVVNEALQKGVQFPFVIRFHDILRSQVKRLNHVFEEKIREAEFQGQYMGVFPIKVNQLREVVEEVVEGGASYDFGLEAGSKAELQAILAMNTNSESLSICNGYKDREFLKLALLGRKLGKKIFVVIEKYSELPELLEIAREMNVKPLIGLRAKLSSQGSGKWASSCGDNAKFGLSSSEIVRAIDLLKNTGMIDQLKLFHFHLGSQITDIKTVKECLTEGARVFCQLMKMGAQIDFFDVGGGLGVDYDGSQSTEQSSTNYSFEDYVADVVYILKQVCDNENIKHPDIVSESGRSIAAHHSCIVTNVFGKITPHDGLETLTNRVEGEHFLVEQMRELLGDLETESLQEVFHDCESKKAESLSAFKLGVITLNEKSKIETLYWKILESIHARAQGQENLPGEIKDLEKKLSSKYLCNFSVFQSLPDSWAIGQTIPIVPIHKLNQKPDVLASIVDITCDSDGKIDHFYWDSQPQCSLPVHELEVRKQYLMGMFLTGAYQDIMGDMHNLFGRLNEVHIFCDDDDPTDYYIEELIKGSRCAGVLSTFQYNPEILASTIKRGLDKLVSQGELRPKEAVELTDFYEDSLASYTYLK